MKTLALEFGPNGTSWRRTDVVIRPETCGYCDEAIKPDAPVVRCSGCGPYLVRMIHGARARPIQKDGTLQRFLLGGLGPAPTVGQPWGDPPGASTCNDHAAFASGCGPYLVRMIHGKKARPIPNVGAQFITMRLY